MEDDEYESDNNNDGQQQQQQQQQETGRNRVSSSLEDDLQQAQREQMEEAIAQMAKRMKDATKGIQHTLEQQTTNTLSQLEDVAEQNVQDVRIVSQNVQQHNTKRWRSQLGTWTLLFSLVGIWVFSLVTVFTIPKRPNACLLFCGKDSRLYRFTGSVVVRMTKSLQLLLTGDDNEDDDGDDETPDKDWEELYEDHDYEREQKEKLDALLQEIQEKETKKDIHQQEDLDWRQALDDEEDNPWGKKPVGKKTRRQEEDDADDNPWGKKPVDMEQRFEEEEEEEEADDNPWGMKPVDTVGGRKQQAVGEEEPDNPWGLKPEKNQDIVQKVSPDDVENRRDRQEGTTMEDDEGDQKRSPPPKVEDINMDDLLASLNQQAIKTKPSDLPSTDNFHRGQMPTPVKDANKRPTEEKKNKGFNPTDAFKRSHSRFSPRDVRVAASTGKHELVEQYLDQQPDVIDKKDKHGWSAIHLAARGGRTKTLEILIQHGAKLSDVTKDGFSPLQIAMDRLGKDHEATRVIVEALGMSTRQPETHHQHEVREMGRRKGEEEEPKIQEMGARKREEEAESPKVKEEEEAQRKIEEARRWAEEEEPEDFDEYVESARRHLDLLRVVEGAQVLPAEEEEEDFEKYVESGRSRLDSLLGPEENYGGRDEL